MGKPQVKKWISSRCREATTLREVTPGVDTWILTETFQSPTIPTYAALQSLQSPFTIEVISFDPHCKSVHWGYLFSFYRWKNWGWKWGELPSTRSTASKERGWNSKVSLNPGIYVWWLWPTQTLLQNRDNHFTLHLGFYPAPPTHFPTLSPPLHMGPCGIRQFTSYSQLHCLAKDCNGKSLMSLKSYTNFFQVKWSYYWTHTDLDYFLNRDKDWEILKQWTF